MVQYIEKDALVEEIENRIKKYTLLQQKLEMSDLQEELQNKIDCLNSIKGYILDTLEVKEVQEEPVSDDLEEEIIRYIGFPQEVDEDVSTSMIRKAAHHFANWQKEQFEKNRLAHCDALTKEQAQMESDFVTKHLKENNRIATFIDAIEYGMALKEKEMQSTIELVEDHAILTGMNKMEQQMMSKAIDGEVGYWNLHGLSVNMDLPSTVEEGDKVKVIVIKED